MTAELRIQIFNKSLPSKSFHESVPPSFCSTEYYLLVHFGNTKEQLSQVASTVF